MPYGSEEDSPPIPILRYGYVVVLCLLAAATALIGQTTPYVIPVGTNPSALGINPATNRSMSSTLAGAQSV